MAEQPNEYQMNTPVPYGTDIYGAAKFNREGWRSGQCYLDSVGTVSGDRNA